MVNVILPPGFWDEEKDNLLAVILPYMHRMAMAGVEIGERKLEQLAGISFDNTLVHAEAARWARQLTDNLLLRLETTSERAVGEILATWIETPGSTIGELKEQLAPVVAGNQRRADNIGVTETTRAYSQGELLTYREAGLPAVVQFNQGFGLGLQPFAPPLHPSCRCWVTPQRLSNGVWVITWQTNRDELVCTRAVPGPWGEVRGCRDLHNVVISEGPFLAKTVAEAEQMVARDPNLGLTRARNPNQDVGLGV